MARFDVEFARSRFPALSSAVAGGWTFLENAGGTYVPQDYLDRLNEFMVDSKVQLYGPYDMSQKGTRAIEDSTVRMAELINADPSEVVIGYNTTMNLYILSRALAPIVQPGDEIIVTNQDHEANVTSWRRLTEQGAVIREWKLDPKTGDLSLEGLKELLNDNTKLVAVNHSSNIVASVNDVKEAARLAHEIGAFIMVDGVSYAPHHAVDVKDLDVDFYTLSLYKVFGPHLGLLYVRSSLHPLLSNEYFEKLPAMYASKPHPGAPNYMRIALNPGGVNHEQVGSLQGVAEYFDALYAHHYPEGTATGHERFAAVFELIEEHASELSAVFLDYVRTNPRIRLIGRDSACMKDRSPTFGFLVEGLLPADIVKGVVKHKIAIQSGSMYAWRCTEALGIDTDAGVIRMSLAHFNTLDEMKNFVRVLDEVIAELS